MAPPRTTPTSSVDGSRYGPPAGPAAQGTSRLTGVFGGRSPAAAPDSVWVPLVAGVLLLAAGVASLAMKKPMLFVGLGPTAIMIAQSPGRAETRFHSVVLGHLVGFACAYATVVLFGAADGSSFLSALSGKSLPLARVWASAFAVALTAIIQPLLRAYHPPAAATALLVTLGAISLTWANALSLLGGVVIVALIGEWFRRVRLREIRAGQLAG